MISSRRDVFERGGETGSVFHKTVLSDRHYDKDLPTIKIIFMMDWPQSEGRPLKFAEVIKSAKRHSILNTLFQSKDFLENQLLCDLSIVEIKIGCVEVLYSVQGTLTGPELALAIAVYRENLNIFNAADITFTPSKRSKQDHLNLEG